MKANRWVMAGLVTLVTVTWADALPPCATPPVGIVGWWPAEQNGDDRAGNNSASLLNGVSFAGGQVGEAFFFDGADDRVMVPSTPALNFGPAQDFSIEAWIQPLVAITDFGVQSIVNKRYTPNFLAAVGYEFHLVNGKLACQLADAPLTTLDFHSFESPGPDLRDGQWHHVALTVDRDSPTGGRLYVDGQVVMTFDPTVQPGDLSTTEPLRIGNHADPALNSHFKGRVDEVSIYNRALSEGEIQAIHAAGSVGKCVLPTLPPGGMLAGPITNGVNGHWYYLLNATNWPAAEGIAVSLGGHLVTINDAAENDWVCTNFSSFVGVERALWLGLNDAGQEWIWVWVSGQPATYLNWAPGEPNNGGGYFFDEDHVLLLPPETGFPLGTWGDAPSNQLHCAVVEVSPPEPVILAGPITNSANGHAYYLLNFTNWPAAEQIAVSLGGHLATINDAAENDWIFTMFGDYGGLERPLWIGLNDSAQEGNWIWVNGEPVTYFNWSPIEPNSGNGVFPDEDHVLIWHPSSGYPLGSWNDAPSNQLHYAVVEVATEPPPCAGNTTGLVGLWRGEGNAEDAILGNHGTLTNGTRYTAGKVGQALQFTGPYDGVVVPSSPVLNVGLAAGFSIEAWINPSTIELERPIVEWNSVVGGNPYPYGAHLWISVPVGYGAGPGCLYANIVDTAGSFHWLTSAAGLIKTGVYQHVALTYDKTSGLALLYLEGFVVAQKNLGTFTPQTGYNLHLGLRPGGVAAAYSWGGQLDEVSIYGRVLAPNEIAAIHAAGSAGKCGPSAALPPLITSPPQDRTVPAGSNTTFSVAATGSYPLRYQWLFGGNPIAGATSSTLSLNNVQPAQGGSYAVVVSNDFGTATSADATLTVQTFSPVIAQQPQSISAYLGGAASFASWATGTAPLGYQWFFNGQPLAGRTASALSLTIVQMDQAGSYWIVATNPYGSATSLAAVLTVIPPRCVPVPDGAVAWWRGESNTVDSVSGNNATYSGIQPVASRFTAGKVGAAFRADVRSYQIIPATAELDVGGGEGLTVEGWIRPDSGTVFRPLITWNSKQSEIGAGLAVNAGRLEGYLTDTNTSPVRRVVMRSPPGAVTNGAWQHVALSFEKLLGVARLYLNGIPVAQTNLGTFRPQTKAQMYLGGFWGGDYYTGGLDEMTVYNRALSETEILAMAEADSSGKCLEPPASECSETPYGLISWWPGDGNPNDAMGTNNVTVFTPALYAKGKVDRAFSLNGSTSRIQINSSPSLNFGTNQDFSIEMWLKAGASNTARPNMPLFEKRSTTAFPWIGYSLSLYQGRPAFTLASAPASPATMSTYIAAGPDLRDDQFHHVAVTVKRASSNGGRLYVDGQLALTFNPVPRNGSLTNSAPVYVGSSISTVSNSTFGGLIDEPAIYNRALLAGEIMALHRAGSTGKCKVPPTILVQPLSQTVTEGSNVTFSVTATGSPLLRYQWYAGGRIQGATNSAYSFLVNSRLGGGYSVRVTNLFATVWSSNAVLTVNYIPQAFRQSVSLLEDAPAAITLTGADKNGDAMSFVILTSPTHGTLSGTPPDLTYQPHPDYFGPDSLTFKVNDGMVDSGPATVSLTVLSVNDPPFAQSQNLSATEDTPLPIHLVAGDIEGNPLTWLVDAPAHGTLSGTAPDLVYHPVAHYFGPDSFVFKVNDGQLDSAPATFGLTVLPVNDPPEPSVVVAPLTTLPGTTHPVVIAPAGAPATVFLDASSSGDVENDPLSFWWFRSDDTNAFATGVVAVVMLPAGTNWLTLAVSDGLDAATLDFNVEVITPAQAIETLIEFVNEQVRKPRPLIASLEAAWGSVQRGQVTAAINQLEAFQNKVRAQIAPEDPALAAQCLQAAQDILEALSREMGGTKPRSKIKGVHRHGNGQVRMEFSAPPGRVYLIEASTNLRDWERIGVARTAGSGELEFEDASAARWATRFYRIVVP